MKEAKKVRSKWLTIRLNEDEEKKLNRLFEKTTSGNLSEYGRDVLLQNPVTILHRNQSADEFLAEMIQLKNELNAIGNNFNQVVKKLHTLDHIPEFRTWVLLNESAKKTFFKKVEEIKEKLNQIRLLNSDWHFCFWRLVFGFFIILNSSLVLMVEHL